MAGAIPARGDAVKPNQQAERPVYPEGVVFLSPGSPPRRTLGAARQNRAYPVGVGQAVSYPLGVTAESPVVGLAWYAEAAALGCGVQRLRRKDPPRRTRAA